MIPYTNHIRVIGLIKRIKTSKQGAKLDISTKQPTGNDVALKMLYRNKLPELVKEGETYYIDGHVERQEYYDKGALKARQKFVADQIIPAMTLVSVAFKGELTGIYPVPRAFSADFAGEVTFVKYEHEWIRYEVKIESENGNPTFINISYKIPGDIRKRIEFKKGEYIACVCTLETKVSIKGEKFVEFNDITILDAAKVEALGLIKEIC